MTLIEAARQNEASSALALTSARVRRSFPSLSLALVKPEPSYVSSARDRIAITAGLSEVSFPRKSELSRCSADFAERVHDDG
jgi:hypothetical protein